MTIRAKTGSTPRQTAWLKESFSVEIGAAEARTDFRNLIIPLRESAAQTWVDFL